MEGKPQPSTKQIETQQAIAKEMLSDSTERKEFPQIERPHVDLWLRRCAAKQREHLVAF